MRACPFLRHRSRGNCLLSRRKIVLEGQQKLVLASSSSSPYSRYDQVYRIPLPMPKEEESWNVLFPHRNALLCACNNLTLFISHLKTPVGPSRRLLRLIDTSAVLNRSLSGTTTSHGANTRVCALPWLLLFFNRFVYYTFLQLRQHSAALPHLSCLINISVERRKKKKET